jgi:hypothetical protein
MQSALRMPNVFKTQTLPSHVALSSSMSNVVFPMFVFPLTKFELTEPVVSRTLPTSNPLT